MKILFTLFFLFSSIAEGQLLASYDLLPLDHRFKYTPVIYRQIVDDAQLRVSPYSQSHAFALIPKGSTVKIMGRDAGFYWVYYKNQSGFVHYVFVDGKYEAFKATNYPHGPQLGYIDYQNEPDSVFFYGTVKYESPLKERPDYDSKTVYTIPPGAMLQLTKENTIYWGAEINGIKGFLSKPYVVATGSSPQQVEKNVKEPLTQDQTLNQLLSEYAKPNTSEASHYKPRSTSSRYYIRGPVAVVIT